LLFLSSTWDRKNSKSIRLHERDAFALEVLQAAGLAFGISLIGNRATTALPDGEFSREQRRERTTSHKPKVKIR
jgi:hypothetical protein